ncbi:type II toxin-antitoxin system HicA family toxin [Hoeflea olei]|uniref:type II toxin-antitoxin system HicA family toxin n=1 Tax=Hoeflea olei TaxID=1480615 RepID=UPI0009F5225E
MSRGQSLIEQFKGCQADFPYKDLSRLLKQLGFIEKRTGGGSKRKFVHQPTKRIIRLHEPHPNKEVKFYMVRQIREQLIEQDLI